MAYRCYDMHNGILQHFPLEGGAMDQDDRLISCMRYAVRTWQIDQRPSTMHTDEDTEWMQNVVHPPRLGDA